nr:tyrosine-type recombinase/integrase [Candidatus Pacearchaeota archaeon]
DEYIFPFLKNDALYAKLVTSEDFQKASPEQLANLFQSIESQIVRYNALLKSIAFRAKIKKNLTSHIARHSFADIARKKVSVYDIQKMLGHSSVKVTEGYLKSLDIEAMDEAMEQVFN